MQPRSGKLREAPHGGPRPEPRYLLSHLLRRCYVEALDVTMPLDVTGHHCGQADLVVAAFNKSLKLVADTFTKSSLDKTIFGT